MLPRFLSIILAIVAHAVFAIGQDFASPEILAAGDPDSILEPLAGRPADQAVDGAVYESKVIRGLLGRRQGGCSNNYFVCGPGWVECRFGWVQADYD
jgi:hypothetical protein